MTDVDVEAERDEIFFPPEVSLFLTELARAIRKHTMYPPAHPALRLALEPVRKELNTLFESRESLTLLIGRSQIAVDDAETDPEHAVLGGLAADLHQHDVAALTFRPGIEEEELGEFLTLVSHDPRRSGRTLAKVMATERLDWPHLVVAASDYERLGLAWGEEEGSPESVDPEAESHLWRELARGLVAEGGSEGTGNEDLSPAEVARSLEAGSADPQYARGALDRLVSMSRELRSTQGPSAGALRHRASEVVSEVSPETLHGILETASQAERHELLHDGARWMDPTSLVKLAHATGSLEGHHVSHTLLLLMAKMARHSTSDAPDVSAHADAGLREQVEELVTGWDREETAVGEYRKSLEQMAFSAPDRTRAREQTKGVAPERVLRIALLANKVGPHVWMSLTALMQTRRFRTLVDALATDDESQAADELWESLASPKSVEWLLNEESPNLYVLDAFLEHLEAEAAPALLDAFVRSELRSVREGLGSRLVGMGSGAGPHVAKRLDRESGPVRCRLLALLGEMETWSRDWSAFPYIEDPDPEVRRQALGLLLRERFHRDRAIQSLLSEDDAPAVGVGLAAAQEGAPPGAIPQLLVILQREDETLRHRLMALRALAPLRPPELLKPLLDTVAAPRRGFLPARFRRRRLRSKTPLVREGLATLARC
ncbi:MAG: hypothetical protein ACE5HQ_10415 [Gemmatimonadota bacterium]